MGNKSLSKITTNLKLLNGRNYIHSSTILNYLSNYFINSQDYAFEGSLDVFFRKKLNSQCYLTLTEQREEDFPKKASIEFILKVRDKKIYGYLSSSDENKKINDHYVVNDECSNFSFFEENFSAECNLSNSIHLYENLIAFIRKAHEFKFSKDFISIKNIVNLSVTNFPLDLFRKKKSQLKLKLKNIFSRNIEEKKIATYNEISVVSLNEIIKFEVSFLVEFE